MNHAEWMVDTKEALRLEDINLLKEVAVDLGVQLEILKQITADLVAQRDAARLEADENQRSADITLNQVRRQAVVILELSKRLRDAGLSDRIGESDKPVLGVA